MREKLTEEYIREVWATEPKPWKPTTFQNTLLLNRALGADVTLASETLQVTGSFKFRAAYNLLASVSEEQVITASSGNFGQAVAYACMLLNKRCTVIMPSTSSKTKQAAIQSYGGLVELIDVSTKSRQARIGELRNEHPQAFFAPPYDHYRVVAGNSTLGKEIFERLAGIGFPLGSSSETAEPALSVAKGLPLDAVLCPIGGGGLISGLIVARDLLAPGIEIIGVEPLLGNDAAQSLRSGRLVSLEVEPQTIADGTRTLSLDDLNWEIVRGGINNIIEVPEEKIAEGLRTL